MDNNSFHLHRTNEIRTIGFKDDAVEASVKKLIDRLKDIERQRVSLSIERDAIKRSLEIIGVTPPKPGYSKESDYVVRLPFRDLPLRDACSKILADHPKDWMTKSQIEYLLFRGGYSSKAKDVKNSVDVTLRRLTAENRIEAERIRGSKGSKYKAIEKGPEML